MNIADYQTRIENVLADALPPEHSGSLAAAMRYSALNGGKRLRAALIYAAAEDNGIDLAAVDAAAAAIECIHAYSLIHDDLPAMDDDDLRRGKASCHIAFGEAEAILAGDALNTLAFELLGNSPLSADIRLQHIRLLSQAAGVARMVGGQSLDIALTGKKTDLAQLQTIHCGKTGALIQAAILMGACPSETFAQQEKHLAAVGKLLGIAYQIHDDILDATADSRQLGKTAGKDAAQEKNTYVQLLGLDRSRALLEESHAQIQAELEQLPHKQALSALIQHIFSRTY